MRNRWYVTGIAVAAAGLLVGAVWMLVGGDGMFALAPAGLAAALIVVAVRVGRCESFSPTAPSRPIEQASSPALERWKQQHAQAADKASDDKSRRSAADGAGRS